MMIPVHSDACAAMHLGPWAVEPLWFAQALSAIRSGVWAAAKSQVDAEPQPLQVLESGASIIRINGPMMKGKSKFGGTSTIDVRRQLREAQKNPDVRGVMLAIDSPGGSVAGTAELADSVAALNVTKPVHAFIEDLGASAAYWTAAQASRVHMNAAGMAGSIGTYSILYDSSKAMDKAGIEVNAFTTGPYKAMGEDGLPITPEQRQYYQGVIEALNERFLAGVSRGRRMEMDKVKALADGRVHVGFAAVDAGLVDRISTFDEALDGLESVMEMTGKTARRDSAERRLRLGS